jgi:uncharacterized protein
MVRPGTYNNLTVTKLVDFGVYLDGDVYDEILMPKRYVPEGCKEGDQVLVFVYFDSEDRVVATTEIPKAVVGDFAAMNVVAVNALGAFMDWGLMKDLFVPFREQKYKMEEGKTYMVYVMYDADSDRIIGTTKIDRFLNLEPATFVDGDDVELQIAYRTPLGYMAIINNTHFGLLYANEIFQPLEIGQILPGFIKKMREDERIDLCLQKSGYDRVLDITDEILVKLRDAGGTLKVTDKSSAEAIYAQFAISKKTFKKAVGSLYKDRLITIEDDGITITHRGKSKNI